MSPARSLLTLPACIVLVSPLAAEEFGGSTFGYQPVPIGAGARALGMGGAFSAVADDATACTWNPAGLAQCERPEVAASLGWYQTRIDDGNGSGVQQALRPEHLSVMYPFFAAGCQQVVGLAWQRQFDFTRDLEISSAVRDVTPFFTMDANDVTHVTRAGAYSSLGLCYAIEPAPGLAFGITINQWAQRWTGGSHFREEIGFHGLTVFTGNIAGTVTDDITTRIETRVVSGTSVVLGSWWQCTPELTVALVVKPSYRLGLETTNQSNGVEVDSTFGTTIIDIHSVIDAQLRYPPSATLGLAWRQGDLDTISFDTTWTRWRFYYFEQPSGRYSPVNTSVSPDDFRDQWSFRAGYEHVMILPQCVVVPRIGALVEFLPAVSQASSAKTIDQVHATSDRWIGASAGASLCQRQTIWDLAVQVRRGENVGSGQYSDLNQSTDMTIITVRAGVTVQF